MTERTLRISARMAEEIQQWAEDELGRFPSDTAYSDDLIDLTRQIDAHTAAQPAPDAVAEAAERVTRYLRRHKQSREAAYENIHSYDASPDGGFYLLASDLEVLVAVAQEPRT